MDFLFFVLLPPVFIWGFIGLFAVGIIIIVAAIFMIRSQRVKPENKDQNSNRMKG